MSDTPQQRAILRQSRIARRVRETFPAGTPVAARASGRVGVVQRHVPGTNGQGGYLVVHWENGAVGSHSASSLQRLDG